MWGLDAFQVWRAGSRAAPMVVRAIFIGVREKSVERFSA
jgi:hypothetical protein